MEEIVDIRSLNISVASTGRSIIQADRLSLKPGDRVAVIGPSGSGKTVFGLALLGLLRTVAPSLCVQADLHWAGNINRPGFGVGYVPQGTTGHLNPYIRLGRQLVEAALSARGAERCGDGRGLQPEINRLLLRLGLDDPAAVCRAYPQELSGGMQQRLAIAMALLVRPRLLLLDEPTTAFDGLQRIRTHELIEEVADAHQTAVLLMTHNVEEVATLGREIVCIADGRLGKRTPTNSRAPLVRGADASAAKDADAVRFNGQANESLYTPSAEARCLVAEGLTAQPGREGRITPFRLSDINLELAPGDRLGVFGASGSGKTTLIRALAGLIPLQRGRVVVFGQDINSTAQGGLKNLKIDER